MCNHPYLFASPDYQPPNALEVIRSSGKLELLYSLLPKLKAAGHRILLFSQMTAVLDIIEDFCIAQGHASCRLDGNVKGEDRQGLLAAFNAPDSPLFIFLLSTRAGGMGLNLQTADTVIMFDSDWRAAPLPRTPSERPAATPWRPPRARRNPQMDAQAEDRAHRIGQRKEVRVLVLVSANTIEEEIQARPAPRAPRPAPGVARCVRRRGVGAPAAQVRARKKRAVDDKVIQAGLFNMQSNVDDQRQMLEQIIARGTEGLDEGAGVPTPEELNNMVARSEEEIELFNSMDEASPRLGLLTEAELPEWLSRPQALLKEEGAVRSP